MQMKLSEIAQAVGGHLKGADIVISAVSIDTRTLQTGQLYVALQGEHFDGNAFVTQAEQVGASAAIVHAGVTTTLPHIVVADGRIALGQLAAAWRAKSQAQVLGVTGSNGKTTTKEMVAAILGCQISPFPPLLKGGTDTCPASEKGIVAAPPLEKGGQGGIANTVLFTQGNLNNDIGVPLTLLRLSDAHRYAVIEMGANHPQEIAYTSQLTQADVVILTNAGAAHLEGFGSLEGVAHAKGEIIVTLKTDGVAILNRDDAYFAYWQTLAGARKTLSFGLSDDAEITASDIHSTLQAGTFVTTFQLLTPTASIPVTLYLAGLHNVKNALAAAAACLALGINLTQIAEGLTHVKPVTGRLQPLVGRMGNIIIDDTYNANAASLQAGLDVLMSCDGQPWLVLGAFGELGEQSAELHKDIGRQIKASGVRRVFAVGADARYAAATFGEGAHFFADQDTLLSALIPELNGTQTLLVKGSRSQRMENIVAALVENFRK